MLTAVVNSCNNGTGSSKSFFKKKKKNYLFIWLSLGLGCIVRGLSLMCIDSLAVAYGLSCSSAYGILVPQPEIKRLHHKVDS